MEFVQDTLDHMKGDKMSKLIGLVAHFNYWTVLGGFNKTPLDDYHMK